MTVRELIQELIKQDMNSEVKISSASGNINVNEVDEISEKGKIILVSYEA